MKKNNNWYYRLCVVYTVLAFIMTFGVTALSIDMYVSTNTFKTEMIISVVTTLSYTIIFILGSLGIIFKNKGTANDQK